MEEALIRKKTGHRPGHHRARLQPHAACAHRGARAPVHGVHRGCPEGHRHDAGTAGCRRRRHGRLFGRRHGLPTEERLIRKALDGLPGVLGLEVDLMQRHVRVRHEPAALPAITAALEGLDMGARLLEGTARPQDAIPAPASPGSAWPWPAALPPWPRSWSSSGTGGRGPLGSTRPPGAWAAGPY